MIVNEACLKNCHLCLFTTMSLPNYYSCLVTKLLLLNCHFCLVTKLLLPNCHFIEVTKLSVTKLLDTKLSVINLEFPKIRPTSICYGSGKITGLRGLKNFNNWIFTGGGGDKSILEENMPLPEVGRFTLFMKYF